MELQAYVNGKYGVIETVKEYSVINIDFYWAKLFALTETAVSQLKLKY